MNILISLDGIGYQTFEKYADSFLNRGYSYCKKMMTTFPSVTFNAHATALTGNEDKKHSVFDNIVSHSKTLEKVVLYGDHQALCNQQLHEQTLFSTLARQSFKSSCIHWPLTTDNPFVQHLVTESSSKKNNSIDESHAVYNLDTIALEETIACIRSNQFDFIATRFVAYDSLSHQFGKDSKEAMESLTFLFDSVDKLEQTLVEQKKPFNIIIFSDHGQSDVKSFFYPNERLFTSEWKEALLTNKVRFIGDGSGSLLFYSLLDEESNQKIMDDFTAMEEVRAFHILEGVNHSPFAPYGILDLQMNVCGEDFIPPEQPRYRNLKSLHGYDPLKIEEMNGFMICKGDQIVENKIVPESNLIHLAPTIAKLFKTSHGSDGEVMKGFLKEHG
ncbi:alkaline phosphatase family protein [Siminovitchia sp. FSL H7-0308]|uniref:alkaline phosphatase family protein n=1 Tax=Siminovitchia sp. FSL H7-0308 TaxID=2921432 RepID=UPI0030EEBEDE